MMIVILVIGLLGIITPVLVDVFNYGGDWRLVGIACMVDICSDMLSKIISEVASFFLNLIPTVGFFLGFAVGVIINEVCSMIFNEDVKDYTVEYCDRAMEKNEKNLFKIFLNGMMYALKKALC